MIALDPEIISDEELKRHHEMMSECGAQGVAISQLALSLWGVVLKELDRRKLVRLVSGSYDDGGNAHIQKLW